MQPDWLPNWLSLSLEWMHQEQALIAGILALIGAGLTVFYLNRQINAQQKHWEDEKSRRLRARRARLPLALSELVDYCSSCYLICQKTFNQYTEIKSNGVTPAPPELPAGAIEILVETLEQSLNENVSIALEKMLSELQVNHARLRSSLNSIPASNQILNVNDQNAFAFRAYEAELLRARVECLFEYARNIRNDAQRLRSPEEAKLAFEFSNQNASDFGELVEKYIEANWPKEDK